MKHPFLVLVPVFASACLTPREAPALEDLELDVPPAWQAGNGAGAVPGEPWWQTFGSPALDAVIDEALSANRDLAASAAGIHAALAQARIAGADRLPSVSAGGSGSRRKQIFVGLPVPGGDVLESTSTTFGADLDISWELDLWGRLAAQAEAAEEELFATRSDHEAARQSLAAATAKAWFAWQEARLQLELSVRTVETFARNTDVVSKRFESGVADALDLRLAKSNLASARALLEQRRAQVARTERLLEVLLGRYPGGALVAGDDLPAVPETPPVGLPAELLGRRPDLSAAEARLRESDARLGAARASLYPRISLTASGGRASDELADLTDDDFSVWSLVGNIVQPIFQGGRLRAGVELAEARVEQATEVFAARLLRAFSEVEIALATESALAEEERHLADASADANAARELAEERYRAGLTDLLFVLEAQRRALASEIDHLAARRRRLETRVDLHLALGGGFEGTGVESPAELDR